MSGTYDSFRENVLKGDRDLDGTVTAHLLTAAYTFDATDDTTGDLTGVAATATVGSKSFTGGRFSSGPVVFTAVTGPNPVVAVAFSVGGNLVAYENDFGAGPGNTSIPLNGSDIQITPDGTRGWFRLIDA